MEKTHTEKSSIFIGRNILIETLQSKLHERIDFDLDKERKEKKEKEKNPREFSKFKILKNRPITNFCRGLEICLELVEHVGHWPRSTDI